MPLFFQPDEDEAGEREHLPPGLLVLRASVSDQVSPDLLKQLGLVSASKAGIVAALLNKVQADTQRVAETGTRHALCVGPARQAPHC